MSLFTLHRVARLQRAFAVLALTGFVYLLMIKAFKAEIQCKVAKENENCMSPVRYNTSTEIKQMVAYNHNQWLWLQLLLVSIGMFHLWWDFSRRLEKANRLTNSLNAALEYSRFSVGKVFQHLALCVLFQALTVASFQYLLNGRFVSFAVAWLINVYHGKSLLARNVACVIGRDPLSKLMKKTTCELPRNLNFELVYLVASIWVMLLAAVTVICLLRYLLFTFSSTLRVNRLKVLLKDLDEKQITSLAEDVELFFKLESSAGEFERLNRKNLLNAVLWPASSDSPSKLATIA